MVTIEWKSLKNNMVGNLKKDGWTVVTKDGNLCAQWEHTIVVTSDGCEILTDRGD